LHPNDNNNKCLNERRGGISNMYNDAFIPNPETKLSQYKPPKQDNTRSGT